MSEEQLEKEVSRVIGQMPLLWLPIANDAGRESRKFIERNAIALLSNYIKPPLDPPSSGWLGHRCAKEKVRESGLWNEDQVEEQYDPSFRNLIEQFLSMPVTGERNDPTRGL